jgi:hypothetical protein
MRGVECPLLYARSMAAPGYHTRLLPFAQSEIPGYELTRPTRSHWSVRLWGHLGPLWAGAFSLGLSREGISILRGFARQDGGGRWVADFLITPIDDSHDPATLDYLALALGGAAEADTVALDLTHYAVDGAPDQGAALYLEVKGPDRLGFLGNLLRSLARLALSPREMMIATRDGEAFDRFFLKTVSGQVPSDEARRALTAVLDSCVRPRPRRMTEMSVAGPPA